MKLSERERLRAWARAFRERPPAPFAAALARWIAAESADGEPCDFALDEANHSLRPRTGDEEERVVDG